MAARELLLLPQEEAEAEAEAGRHVITLVVAAVSLVPRMRGGGGSVTPTTKLEPFPRSWRQILFVEKCIPPPPQLLPFILQ